MKRIATAILSFSLCIILTLALSSCGAPVETAQLQPSETQPEEDRPSSYTAVASSYAYDHLSEKEQALYEQIKIALLLHEPSIEDGLEGFTHEQLGKVHRFVMLDSPEIFWANESGTTYTSELNGVKSVTKYEFHYTLDKTQRDAVQEQIDASTASFLNTVEPGLSEYERVLAVYEYIIETTDYDLAAKEKIASDSDDDSAAASQTIESVFVSKKTVCSGYSKATQYLLNKLGVFCLYISGSAKGEGNNHAWNLVKIDGDCYLLDTTWGNPISDDPAQGKRMTYNYFCLTTDEFNKTHTPNVDIPIPDCSATKYNYFVYNKLLCAEYDTTQLETILSTAAADGQAGINIKFADSVTAQKAMDALFGETQEIFKILRSASAANAELDTTSVSNSFDPDTNVLYIILNYK